MQGTVTADPLLTDAKCGGADVLGQPFRQQVGPIRVPVLLGTDAVGHWFDKDQHL